jgi:hypothetical protein
VSSGIALLTQREYGHDVLSLLGLLAVAACYTVFIIGLYAIGLSGPLVGIISVAAFLGLLALAMGSSRDQ